MAESPAQEAARLRRERREAKIKAGGSARLDKITSLSGRTPSSAIETSPTPPSERASPQPQPQPLPQPQLQRAPPSPSAQNDNVQAQEEYLRALLRSQQPPTNPSAAATEDPTAKLLSGLLGSGGGIPPEALGGGGGGGAPGGNQNPLGDLSSATGIPSFLTDMLMGQPSAPKTAGEQRNERILKVLHVLLSVVVGVYLLLLIRSSTLLYGSSSPPPPPSTAQNPFTVFVMGELVLLGGGRVLGVGKSNGGGGGGGGGRLAGAMGAFQVLRGVVRDGGIAVFVMGFGTWWLGSGQG